MNTKTKKELRKQVSIFQEYFNTKNELKVIVDLGAVKDSSIRKYDLVEAFERIYDLKVELYTTSCLLEECRLLGEIMEKTYNVMKHYTLLECSHKYNASCGGSEKCVERYINLWSNTYKNEVKSSDKHHLGDGKNWAIISNCPKITKFMNDIPGILFFEFKCNQLILKPLSFATKSYIEKVDNDKKKKQVEAIKKENARLNPKVEKKKKPKTKNPNPLSVKKSTKVKNTQLRKRRMSEAWKIIINKQRVDKNEPPLTDFPDYVYYEHPKFDLFFMD